MNQPTNASRITHHLRRRGLRRASSAAIYSVVIDGDNALCLTEPQLDAWWRSLSPEDKAEIYEQHLGDGVERCLYCGCTQSRACVTSGVPCAWLDPNHTVCSAPQCATRYASAMFDEVFHGGPQSVVTRPLRTREQLEHFVETGECLPALEMPPQRRTYLTQSEDRARIDCFLRSGRWLTDSEWLTAHTVVTTAAELQEVADATV